MNWSALTQKQKHMAIATVVLAVAWIFVLAHFFGWIQPSESGGSEKEKLAELEEQIEKARSFLLQREPIAKSLRESVSALQKQTAFAPTTSDRYAWAYEYVSRCATQSGIELDSVEEILFMADEKNSEKGSKLEAYKINVSTRCDYNSLVEFLWYLEGGNPLLRIKDVRISTMADVRKFHQVRVQMEWPIMAKVEQGG
jgi:hypothetical protein